MSCKISIAYPASLHNTSFSVIQGIPFAKDNFSKFHDGLIRLSRIHYVNEEGDKNMHVNDLAVCSIF